jgi:DNA mismatch endonuclease (patch repair protein)
MPGAKREKMDRISKKARTNNMRRIVSSNTKPEKAVKTILRKQKISYRSNLTTLPGKPDICLMKDQIAIFVHGCFWHQHKSCKKSHIPKSNLDYWKPKLEKNKKRDVFVKDKLKCMGWKVIVIWECMLAEPGKILKKLSKYTIH